MKVLQFGRYYPPVNGGIETVIHTITNGLTERGIQCDVLCSNKSYEYSEEVDIKSTIIRTKSFGEVFSVSISPQFVSKLRLIGSRYDIIHVHHPDPMAAIAIFLNRPKAKIILHWHSDIVKQKVGLVFYRPLQNWLLMRADLIIGTSIKYIEESEDLQKYRHKAIAIPIGIKSLPPVSRNEVMKYRDRYHGKFIVFALGRFVYYKGFENLIKAASFLDDDYVILIGGSGPNRKKYDTIIETKKLSSKVKLLGKLSLRDLVTNYMSCDLFCLPSVAKSEAFGIVMIEAMSFGKPILSTKIIGSGVDWVNQHNMTGITVPPNDPNALADAIKEMATNTERRSMFERNAKLRFQKKFTYQVMMDSIVNSYLKVLSENNSGKH